MTLIKDFMGRRGRKGDLGLEVEVEAAAELPTMKDEHWTTHAERSLRATHCAEYVSNGPQAITAACKGIRSLCWELNLKKYKVDQNSTRTSFHVHSNQLYATPVQFWNNAVAYWLVEDLLYEYFHPLRKGNCFALRLTDAEGVLLMCYKDLKEPYPFGHLATDNIRYAGQNLAAINKFGTIERRGMDGRLDAARMETWVTELHSLDTKSRAFSNPSIFLDKFFEQNAKSFLESLFSESFAQQLMKTADWRDRLQNSAATVAELAYFHSWDAWEKKLNDGLAKNGAKEIMYDEVAEPPTATAAAIHRERVGLDAAATRFNINAR